MEYYRMYIGTDNYQQLGFGYGRNGYIMNFDYTSSWPHQIMKGKEVVVESYPPSDIMIERGTKSRKKPNVYYLGAGMLIADKKIKEKQEEVLKESCQFIPVKLVDAKRPEEEVYIINPLVVGDCLVREKVEYKKEWIYEKVTKIVLDEERIPDTPMFLILEKLGWIIINEDIKRLLEDNKAIGMDFMKVEVEVSEN